jgi:hypothetical protein
MVRQRKHHFSLIIVLSIGQWLMGQDCDYASMEKLLEEAKSLNLQDYPNPDDLQSVTNDLEGMLITCAQKEFPGKDSLEYQYYDNLVELCKKLADVEGQVRYLNSLKDHSIRDEKYSDIDGDIKRIEQDYGPLRIRFEGTTLKEMATLKTTGGAHVSINILPPPNAWVQLKEEKKRKEKRERLKFIQKKSLEGDLEVFFDSYDPKDRYFYFKLPFVPYLEGNSSEDWYAITFDKKKRYRINFPRPTPKKPTKPLIIKPEEGWFLETSTPETWVKLSFPNLKKQRLKFEDRQTGTRLSSSEYIKIDNEKMDSVDYYLPSDRDIDIIFSDRGQSFWQNFNKIISGGLFVVLSYFIYAGVT